MGAQKMAMLMVKTVLMQLDSAPYSEKDWSSGLQNALYPYMPKSTRTEKSYGWTTQYYRALEEESDPWRESRVLGTVPQNVSSYSEQLPGLKQVFSLCIWITPHD